MVSLQNTLFEQLILSFAYEHVIVVDSALFGNLFRVMQASVYIRTIYLTS